MHALVDDLSQAVVHEGTPSDAVWLALAVLNKRALSSARSLQQTVERRLAAVELEPDDAPYQLGLPLEDGDGETDKADEPPELSGLSLSNPVHERRLLQELAAAAGAAAAAGETKLAALVRLLRRIGEPAVVFTEYRDTLQHLARRLRRPAAILHGGLSRGARAAALSDFTSGRRAVLLTTDAAGEGLNLHQACRLVINLELPWNPMRLEQRIGRVDRIGQRRKVHAVHLIARSTGETRILERLRARIARARQSIGAPDPLAGEDERTIARFLLDERVNTEEAVPAATALPLAAPSLASEARAEAERLDEVRRILASNRGKPALEPDGAWISWTRQRATRSALRGRVLVIARSTCEDGWGRRADSALVPMLIPWQRGKIDGIDAERSASSIATSIAPSVVRQAEAALASWRERAIATGNRFFAARFARARAIAGVKRDAPFWFQPGLFDRRAEHQRLADATRSADEHEQSTREVLSLERRSRLSIGSPEILLVLLP
jgi:alpha-D-ribose 1-methylphosphonate 5-triphosphate synthase subunit PhnG